MKKTAALARALSNSNKSSSSDERSNKLLSNLAKLGSSGYLVVVKQPDQVEESKNGSGKLKPK